MPYLEPSQTNPNPETCLKTFEKQIDHKLNSLVQAQGRDIAFDFSILENKVNDLKKVISTNDLNTNIYAQKTDIEELKKSIKHMRISELSRSNERQNL